MRSKSNDELFGLYEADLRLRVRNPRNLKQDVALLRRFEEYLAGFPPTKELAKGFLAQYAESKPRTLARHAATIRGFMKWCGEEFDLKVPVPKTLPPYVERSDIERLLEALSNKKTHKKIIERDCLLVELACQTGLRRAELANLEVRHIQDDFLFVRGGKGGKDRLVPLNPRMAQRLHSFFKDKQPHTKVFGLKPVCIGSKIRLYAKKANVDLRTHSLRHYFATTLLEKGANVRQVQLLLGHQDLSTTQGYLAVVDAGLREAVSLLEDGIPSVQGKSYRQVAAEVEDTKLRTVKLRVDPRYEYVVRACGNNTYIGSHRVGKGDYLAMGPGSNEQTR